MPKATDTYSTPEPSHRNGNRKAPSPQPVLPPSPQPDPTATYSPEFHELLDGMADNPIVCQELARMSHEQRDEWLRNNPPAPWKLEGPPTPTPAQVLQLAISEAEDLASALHSATRLLEVLHTSTADDGREVVEADSDALAWLAKKMRDDLGDIMNHLDCAENARQGNLYGSDTERYGRAAVELESEP